MRRPLIHLVLTDDWELRGDGSGEMRRMQFSTIRELTSIYNEFGLKGTFMVETMQQLYHRRLGRQHPELAALAEEWDAIVRSVYLQGHDIQLHVHPQWQRATFRNGQWSLTSPWAVGDYSASELRAMLESAKACLEDLLRPLDPSYKCRAFRAGSWLAFPSDHLVPTMADLGLVADLSVVPGWNIDSVFRGQRLFADYRQMEGTFLPYFPVPNDPLRKGLRGPVHCVPTHTFRFGFLRRLQRRSMKALGFGREDLRQPNALPPTGAGGNTYDRQTREHDVKTPLWLGKLQPLLQSSHRISDLSALSFWEAKVMLKQIRQEARRSGWAEVPVILANHTKSIGDFSPIRRFAEHLASAPDVQVVTLRAVCDNLLAGRYPIEN
jgi:hypothetical protein